MTDQTKLLEWISKTGINNLIFTTDLDHTVLDTHRTMNPKAPPNLEDIFHALDDATEGRFYIVTGREMEYVDQLFPSVPLKASTEYHNVMRWNLGGQTEEMRPKPQWQLIDSALQPLLQQFWPEAFSPRIKPFMRSIHYSQAPALQDPHTKDHIESQIKAILDDYKHQTGQSLTVIDGGKVFDIAPEGSSKGPAIDDIIADCADNFPGRVLTPIYFGDSPGDLPAAQAVQEAGGKFVAVGNDEHVKNIADFHLHAPDLCRVLLFSTARLQAQAPQYKQGETCALKPAEPEGP